MKESNIQQDVRLTLSKGGVVTFRNNQGAYEDDRGRWVKYGVGQPGGSDLIGWKATVVTPDMVGKPIAIFAAVEVKTEHGRVTEAQQNFIDQVKKAGGIAGVVRSAEDAELLLKQQLLKRQIGATHDF